MTRFSIPLLWSLLTMAGSYAQTNEPPQRVSAHIKLAYSGSLLYPGFRAGVEVPMRRLEVAKSRSGELTKRILREQLLVASLGGYHHPTFHDNLYLTVEWTRRRTAPSGFFTEFSPGLGYSRTFLGGTTYTVDDAGQVTAKHPGRVLVWPAHAGRGPGLRLRPHPGAAGGPIHEAECAGDAALQQLYLCPPDAGSGPDL